MPDYSVLDSGRSVLHGIDNSVETNAVLPARGHHGSHCMTEDLLAHSIYDPGTAEWKPDFIIPFEFSAAANGTVATHDLLVTVPAGTIILDAFFDVLETFTSGGSATVAFQLEAANDIKTGTAYGTYAAGLLAAAPTGAVNVMIRTTTERQIKAVVATAALTAGHLIGFLRCANSWLAAAIQSSSSSSSSSASSSSSSSVSSSCSSFG